MPLPNQSPTTEIQNLHNVIDSSTPDRLRTVLKDLIALTPANYAHVKDQLMLPHGALKRAQGVYENFDNDDKVEDLDRDFESEYFDEGHDAPVSRRRVEICEQCGEEYDALLNDKESCEWHEGELEVDWDGDF